MFENMDVRVKEVIGNIRKHGYEAYIVGGAVRNMLLGFSAGDYDIVTSALPQEIMEISPKSIPTGLKHGTVTVLNRGLPIEVTTMRTEDTYSDMRHPDEVIFVKNLADDLKRRDFTVNAMAWDPTEDKITDLFGGREDLKKRIIRTVGDPDRRFSEDALRMMRAVRFASQYNFNLEPRTFLSVIRNASLINKVSAERIRTELFKILMSEVPSRGLFLLLYTGLMAEILPELTPMAGFHQFSNWHDKDVFSHTMSVADNTPEDLNLRIAALFHDSGKPYTFTMDEKGMGHFYGHEDESVKIADKVLRRLKCDNKTREMVLKIIGRHMVSQDIKKDYKIKNLIRDFGKENIHYFFEFRKADFGGKPMEPAAEEKFSQLKQRVDEIMDDKEPLEIKDLDIRGEDLTAIGFERGPEIGKVLEALLQLVLRDPRLNRKKILSEQALKMKERNEI